MAEVVARLAALLGPHQGEVEPLEGSIVNRKFKIRFDGADYVVRLPRDEAAKLGIDLDAECTANSTAAALGIAPPVTRMLQQPPCLVTMYLEGDSMKSAELRQPAAVEEIALALRGFHDSGATLPSRFDPFAAVEDDAAAAKRAGAELPKGYRAARTCARKLQEAVAGQEEHRPVPCNNDLVASSFLQVDGGIRIVDWEYAAMNDRFFDLGNFAVSNGLDEDAETRLLEAYFGEPPGERRLAALRAMRFLSDFREAMWGIVQSTISDIDYDFDGWAEQHFERLRGPLDDGHLKRWIKETGRCS